MALEVNCTKCTDPTCNGNEYQVKYDYDHYGRMRGTKVVCDSQVWRQGNRAFHTIHADQYQFKFEAIPVETLEEEAELFPEVIKPETKVEDERTEDSTGSESDEPVIQEDGELPEQQAPAPRE